MSGRFGPCLLPTILFCFFLCDGTSSPSDAPGPTRVTSPRSQRGGSNKREEEESYIPPMIKREGGAGGESTMHSSINDNESTDWRPQQSPRQKLFAASRASASGASPTSPRGGRGRGRGGGGRGRGGGPAPASPAKGRERAAKEPEPMTKEWEWVEDRQEEDLTQSGDISLDDTDWGSVIAELEDMIAEYSKAPPVDIDDVKRRQHGPLENPFDDVWVEASLKKGRVLTVSQRRVTGAECTCVKQGWDDLAHSGVGELHVSPGRYEWGDEKIRAKPFDVLQLRGLEDRALLVGRWDLAESSQGTFHGCAFEWSPPGETILDKEPWHTCIVVWGGPWAFDQCNFTSVGGTPIAVSVFGGALMRSCCVGGLEGVDRNSVHGVDVRWAGRLRMIKCTIQHTGYFSGMAARSVEAGQLTMVDCDFAENDFAVFVSGPNGTAILEGCRLESQRWAAFSVGVEEGASIVIKGSRIRGMLFQDTCTERRNETVVREIRDGRYFGREEDIRKDLYINEEYHYRRPEFMVEENNEYLKHCDEFSFTDRDSTSNLEDFLENHVHDGIRGDHPEGGIWYEPEQSDEDQLYEDAAVDLRREELGKQPTEHVDDYGTVHTGEMNYTAYKLQEFYRTYANQEDLESIKQVVRDQSEFAKSQVELEERDLPPQLRRGHRSKPGRDLPYWWTPFDIANLEKDGMAAWGYPTTEWSYPFRKKTEAELEATKEYTIEEVLYGEPREDDVLTVTKDDLDPDKRPRYLTWPLEIDRVRRKKLEKRLGMPYSPYDKDGLTKLKEVMERKAEEEEQDEEDEEKDEEDEEQRAMLEQGGGGGVGGHHVEEARRDQGPEARGDIEDVGDGGGGESFMSEASEEWSPVKLRGRGKGRGREGERGRGGARGGGRGRGRGAGAGTGVEEAL